MQPSTGQTSAQRLQPTHSSSMMRGTCTPIPLGFFSRSRRVRARCTGARRLRRRRSRAGSRCTRSGVNVGDDFVIQVQVAPILHVGHGAAAKILDGAKSVVVHVRGQAVDHVFDDAESVVHRRGADLHDGRAQRDVLGGVVPVSDAADSDDRNFHRLRDAGNQVQRDRLHGRAAIAAVRRLSRPRSAAAKMFPGPRPSAN